MRLQQSDHMTGSCVASESDRASSRGPQVVQDSSRISHGQPHCVKMAARNGGNGLDMTSANGMASQAELDQQGAVARPTSTPTRPARPWGSRSWEPALITALGVTAASVLSPGQAQANPISPNQQLIAKRSDLSRATQTVDLVVSLGSGDQLELIQLLIPKARKITLNGENYALLETYNELETARAKAASMEGSVPWKLELLVHSQAPTDGVSKASKLPATATPSSTKQPSKTEIATTAPVSAPAPHSKEIATAAPVSVPSPSSVGTIISPITSESNPKSSQHSSGKEAPQDLSSPQTTSTLNTSPSDPTRAANKSSLHQPVNRNGSPITAPITTEQKQISKAPSYRTSTKAADQAAILPSPPSLPPIPAAITAQPPSIPSQPPALAAQPPTISSQPPALASQPPATPSQPPTIASLPPAIPAEPPALASQPPAIPSRPPTIASLPPAIPAKPPALASQPPATPSPPPAIASLPPAIPTGPAVIGSQTAILPATPRKLAINPDLDYIFVEVSSDRDIKRLSDIGADPGGLTQTTATGAKVAQVGVYRRSRVGRQLMDQRLALLQQSGYKPFIASSTNIQT